MCAEVLQRPDYISIPRTKHYSSVLCGSKTITDHGCNDSRQPCKQENFNTKIKLSYITAKKYTTDNWYIHLPPFAKIH
jgi:hypothetical protein